jgi:SNF2 family DNA or RNA helicase
VFEVSGHRVILKDSPSGASESLIARFWDSWVSHGIESLPLELAGLARLRVGFRENDQEISLIISFDTEIGTFNAPEELDAKWDHFVDPTNVLVPLRINEIQVFFEILHDFGIQKNEGVSIAKVFRLIVELRNAGIDCDLPDDFGMLTKLEPVAARTGALVGTPYLYQSTGIDWLTDYFDNGLGALLCDEMGLGKTFQAIGLISHAIESNQDEKILIVAPASLVANWTKELKQFLPSAAFDVHVGPLRAAKASDFGSRIILTTYETLIRDRFLVSELKLMLVVADEAQALKNFRSQRHVAVKNLECISKVLVTGTPVENKLADLSALVNIVHPGLLGQPEDFVEMIEDTPAEARELGRLASPMILRRRVAEVAKDLPELVMVDTPLSPSHDFTSVYESLRLGCLGKPAGAFLGLITKLSQACCSPQLIEPGFRDPFDTKIARLMEVLSEIHEIGKDKILVFTTFKDSIDMLVGHLSRAFGNDSVAFIDGRVTPSDRQQIVDSFNSTKGFKALIINPKAGGTGLNITGANHVIHFNRQWNPAVEAQANARSYRRKQEKTVFVHRFYYLGTVEEIMHERLRSKLDLSDAALEFSEQTFDLETQTKYLTISPLAER